MIKKLFALVIIFVMLGAFVRARAQSLSLPQIPLNTTIYEDFHSRQFGVVLTAKIDSLKKMGADLYGFMGTTSDSTKFSDFTGIAGGILQWMWTYPKTKYFLAVGPAISWNAQKQIGGGIAGQIGFHF